MNNTAAFFSWEQTALVDGVAKPTILVMKKYISIIPNIELHVSISEVFDNTTSNSYPCDRLIAEKRIWK